MVVISNSFTHTRCSRIPTVANEHQLLRDQYNFYRVLLYNWKHRSKSVLIKGSPENCIGWKTAQIIFFGTHVARTLEHDNVFICIVFTGEARFHISGHVSRHNCVTWGSEPSTEHLERERYSPKVNMWWVLARHLFLFCEDVITSSFFPDILENYVPPQINKK